MEKILVVEDDKNIAQLEIDYLNSSGYETKWIGDGAKVIEELRKNSYDLLLLDLMLPNVDGYEICRNVRDEIEDDARNPQIIETIWGAGYRLNA